MWSVLGKHPCLDGVRRVSEDKDKEFGREFGALGIWISFER